MQAKNSFIEVLGIGLTVYALFKIVKTAYSEYKRYRERKAIAIPDKHVAPPSIPGTAPAAEAAPRSFPTRKARKDPVVELDKSDLCQKEYVPDIAEVTDINHVNDIDTLYSYLMHLRSKMSKDEISRTGVSLLVREANTFISTRMIDLREVRGLICTDGINLLQFTGEELKPTGFILTKIKSVNSIPSYLFEQNRARFYKMWDRASWSWLAKGGPRRFREVFFVKRTWALRQIIDIHTSVSYKVAVAENDPTDFLHDPAVYLRTENKYPFISAMDKIVSDILQKDTSRFDHTKTIVGVSDFGEVFVLDKDNDTKTLRLIPFPTIKMAANTLNRDSLGGSLSKELKMALKKIDGHIDDLLSYDGKTVVDRTLGLRFFEI